ALNLLPTSGAISGSITGATNPAAPSPIIITTTSTTGLQTGERVTISGVQGNTAANGTWTITVINGTEFALNGAIGNGTYTSGGTWTYGVTVTPNAATNETSFTVNFAGSLAE